MKQLLLFLMAMTFAIGASAQQTIWEEDFSEGMHGWEVKSPACENYNGSDFGVWNLTSGTVDGEAVDFSDGYYRWSFINPIEYSISFADDIDAASSTVYGTVYSRYTMSNDTLNALIDEGQVIGDGVAFVEQSANGIVDWATNLKLDGGLAETIRMIGAGQPTITYTNGGQNFTYTAEDGAVVLEFTKETECGTFWTWSPTGNVGYGLFGLNPGLVLGSTTSANGVMVCNTLLQNSLGDPDYDPGLPPFPKYVSELISPPIDISSAGRALSLEVSEMLVFLNPFPVQGPTDAGGNTLKSSFSISTDDGLTWSPASDINPTLANNALRDRRVSVPILNAYVNDADEIRIKFTWATDLYFWAIDDIAIVERVGYEMQANENFFGIPTNVNTPASQVEDVYWMSDIQNNGGFTAENVTLNLTLTDATGTVELYNGDKIYGDITPDSLAENSFFETPLSSEALEVGTYFGAYSLRHDSIDSNPGNDSLFFQFSVTDTLFAKEEGRTRGLFVTPRQWYIGNSFYVPNGDGWYARYISFMVDNASAAVNGTGRVNVLLYESDGDVNGDGAIDETEYILYGINDYVFDGSEDETLITVPVDLSEGLPLRSGKHYLAVIQYIGNGEADQLAISGSEVNNYNANYFIMDSLMMPRYMNVVDLSAADNPTFNRRGFGGTVAPVVRLSIGNNPNLSGDAIVATDNILSDDYQMLVFPNPADLEVKLQLDLPEQQDVNVRLFDQNGRMLLSRDYEKLDHGVFTYDVSKLPSGTYWVQLSTNVGTKTEKVIVSH